MVTFSKGKVWAKKMDQFGPKGVERNARKEPFVFHSLWAGDEHHLHDKI